MKRPSVLTKSASSTPSTWLLVFETLVGAAVVALLVAPEPMSTTPFASSSMQRSPAPLCRLAIASSSSLFILVRVFSRISVSSSWHVERRWSPTTTCSDGSDFGFWLALSQATTKASSDKHVMVRYMVSLPEILSQWAARHVPCVIHLQHSPRAAGRSRYLPEPLGFENWLPLNGLLA